MARRFQLWQKKRGHRRTGSRIAGSVGEGLLFASMLLGGSFALIALTTSRLVNIPGVSSLNTGSGLWLSVIVLTSFVLIGAGGLLWNLLTAGTSAERRKALASKAAELELLRPQFPDAKDFPTIPLNENLFNSPGVHLTYRLPCSTTPTWNLLALAVLCLMLNGLLAAVAMVVIKSFIAGSPKWILGVLMMSMFWAAVKLTWYFLAKLNETIRIGPTAIEVSDLPLFPGRRYDICITQTGRMSLRSMKVSLACDESATYREGTDVRNEVRRVSLQKVLHCDPNDVVPGTPFVHQGELVLSPEIMHSFQSSSNAIQWKLVVEGRTVRGRSFERVFPVVVFPPISPAE